MTHFWFVIFRGESKARMTDDLFRKSDRMDDAIRDAEIPTLTWMFSGKGAGRASFALPHLTLASSDNAQEKLATGYSASAMG